MGNPPLHGRTGDRMPDHLHEAFLRLFTRCEPELRAFVRSCLPRPQDVDEVMQEVSLVAWRKFGDLDDRGRFAPWACLIARYEILKLRDSQVSPGPCPQPAPAR